MRYLIIFIMAIVIGSFALSATGSSGTTGQTPITTVDAQPRTYLVSYAYNWQWGKQKQGTIRVTTVYYTTDGQEFLMAVIRTLKEAGVVPVDELFDHPKKSALDILSIDPIPADFVFSTTDPLFDPTPNDDDDANEDAPKKKRRE